MEYDVLIIGSRVAGSSLALLLGKRGHRVLLVDRDRFPSDTLSTNVILPHGISLLSDLGVLADVEAAGFRRITRARTYIDDLFFEGPIGPPGVYYLVPRRTNLDAILLDHATRQATVDSWSETIAEDLIRDADRVAGAVVRTADGRKHEIRARVVVGADGKDSAVAKWVKAPVYDEEPAIRPVYYGYYEGVKPLPEPTLELFFVRDRIGFLFPMQPGVDCLILELQPDDFNAFRANPKAMFEETFRALPYMASRLENATLQDRIFGTRGVPNRFRKPYGPGWVLTGDAGHVKDSSTGFGIRDALLQSFLLSDLLDAVLNGADWELKLSEFESTRDRIMKSSYQSTIAATQLQDLPPAELNWFRGILANPHLCRAFMQSIARALPNVAPQELTKEIRSMGKLFGAKE
jgi:flavin-dependent dehydrogenase